LVVRFDVNDTGEEVRLMGTIVCQCCDRVIAHFDDEKVNVLFGVCPACVEEEQEETPSL